ncbi:hypothetical protein KNJ79_04990 [Sphingopyxis indica]|uniref:hypothetical protein n=1 Tax=Sphingopyxis indica TaxID=436663 RepID=UPI002939309E|nr:hypothetical protein [Sphingopyxis indica]WOF44287.1 hypothetical protein KNJ79_04990 [Sphingopyxis indica]
MSRQYVYEARDLVDAGVFHKNILARCPCGHWAILESIDLWAWFRRRGWDERLYAVPRRLRCTKCFQAGRVKQGPSIELVMKDATVRLPFADMREWKREVQRRR